MESSGARSQRVDRWLFFARITKSRTLAQKLCEAGHVRINRAKAKSGAKPVSIGDVLTISLSSGVRVLRVTDPGERRGPTREARMLYEDVLAQGESEMALPESDGE
ncbi:RNA-binding S4 domain-containing protein [Notoacmeibacter ruber]|uniref:RNA-binding S4 domain-containing protein n=1 Tax=Notoacmeibacter ruber TaxID=2670375 RepID=A0A3L7JIW3_9HYPH|nr:RNA-binding S4 domain-containing protein [Notoacmeibacter ruber]